MNKLPFLEVYLPPGREFSIHVRFGHKILDEME